MRVFYCGCIGEAGHYIWASKEQAPPEQQRGGFLSPPTVWPKAFRDWDRAKPRYEQIDGWSLVCVIDNTIDQRGGSHSTVIAEGEHTEDELWALLKQHFPMVHVRLVAGGVIDG